MGKERIVKINTMSVPTLPLGPCAGDFFFLISGKGLLLSDNTGSLQKSGYTPTTAGNITLSVFGAPRSGDVGSWVTWRQPVPCLSTLSIISAGEGARETTGHTRGWRTEQITYTCLSCPALSPTSSCFYWLSCVMSSPHCSL